MHVISLATFFLNIGIATFLMIILVMLISTKQLIQQKQKEQFFYVMYDKIKDKTVEEIMNDGSLTNGFNTSELVAWRELVARRELINKRGK